MPKSPCAVFIDLDDTLTDRTRAFATWASAFLAAHGAKPDLLSAVIQYDNEGRRPREEFFAGLSGLLGITFDTQAALVTYRESTGNPPATDGVEASLVSLRNRHATLCILSNGVTEVQTRKLQSTGLIGWFDHVIVSDQVGYSKPSFQIYEYARGLVDPRSDCWMVGDHLVNDISGAKLAGFQTAWVSRGRTDAEATRHADVVRASASECLDEIARRYPS